MDIAAHVDAVNQAISVRRPSARLNVLDAARLSSSVPMPFSVTYTGTLALGRSRNGWSVFQGLRPELVAHLGQSRHLVLR